MAIQQVTNPYSSLKSWLNTQTSAKDEIEDPDGIDWLRASPFILMHLALVCLFWVGVSPLAFSVAVGLYVVRMFAITGFYHRYFSHKNFKTSRLLQFIFAFIGTTAAQRGPLWWAAHHRHHHRVSDKKDDPHSPVQRSFLWSHCLWFLSNQNFPTQHERVKDLMKYPELRWLDQYDWIPPALLGSILYLTGLWLETSHPQFNTSGSQMLVWGLVVSTLALYHATYTINSLAHRFGRRRFQTRDQSRNNWLLAIITLGEGWHNNHHYYCGTVRQGFKWWEFDLTYYLLTFMSWLGLVWDLKPIPQKVKLAMKTQASHSITRQGRQK